MKKYESKFSESTLPDWDIFIDILKNTSSDIKDVMIRNSTAWIVSFKISGIKIYKDRLEIKLGQGQCNLYKSDFKNVIILQDHIMTVNISNNIKYEFIAYGKTFKDYL